MADTLTLLQLRTRSRERCDMVNSTFVTDAEFNGYINYSYKELYDLIIDAVEDYNLSQSSFTISSGNTASLPSDFYKLRGLDDMSDPANPRTVRKFIWNERNDYNPYGLARLPLGNEYSDVNYRIVGSQLIFQPPEAAAKPYNLWYVPTPVDLASDSDVATGINGWLEYVIIDAAIKALVKEESDTRALERAKGSIRDRINDMKNSRDQGLPEKISRVRNKRYRGLNYGDSGLDGY
jgi:hypothetical protein